MSEVYKAVLAKIVRDERLAAIQYDLSRVHTWPRRYPLSFGRRAPGLISRIVCWLVK